ncbi:hypothetical protein K437DRAFT_74054 [Tilletiaria anomala UBC 951]|uniref:Uncharacterized protein n=1 Tax=Tilletiaria anomala (strain ATCC 24038 / CBS 436.72 / UBC 951) TaxID=1037660 RepID=A0A066WBM4_TILAU|nr:uncharacterized protein K437DRAFT_74054 [Tilletiaria anomala UBC 951]KDN49928.1 hypothetical protein K437DRAFT_74054 [Tilletiaria anomala UBC 951]
MFSASLIMTSSLSSVVLPWSSRMMSLSQTGLALDTSSPTFLTTSPAPPDNGGFFQSHSPIMSNSSESDEAFCSDIDLGRRGFPLTSSHLSPSFFPSPLGPGPGKSRSCDCILVVRHAGRASLLLI